MFLSFVILALAACSSPPAPVVEKVAASSSEPPAGVVRAVEPAPPPPESPVDVAAEDPDAALADAVRRACVVFAQTVTDAFTIAVVNISSADPDEAEFAAEEHIFQLLKLKMFSLVEHRHLDQVRVDGIANGMVLHSGTMMRFAQALRAIGALYYAGQDELTALSQVENAAYNQPTPRAA
jgi:hypothetical protein